MASCPPKPSSEWKKWVRTSVDLLCDSFDFSVMARSVRLNPFVPNMKLCGFKKSEDIPFAVGKPIRNFKAVIRSDAFDLYPFAGNLLVGLGRSLFLGHGWFD